ncbi:putative holin-like toxin [Bacillus tianshenii]|nr:putative holin-like toxin [Bacillus tianshenii]
MQDLQVVISAGIFLVALLNFIVLLIDKIKK